jgi:hypothetical protein
LGAGALAGRKRTSWGVVVVGSWGLLLKPGVLDLRPLTIYWDPTGRRETTKFWGRQGGLSSRKLGLEAFSWLTVSHTPTGGALAATRRHGRQVDETC